MPLIGLAVYLISIRHCNTWTLAPSPLSRRPARERMGVQKANPKHSQITTWFTRSSIRGAAETLRTEDQLPKTRRTIERKSLWRKRHRIVRRCGGTTLRRISQKVINLNHGFGTRKRRTPFGKKIICINKKCDRTQSSWLSHLGSDPWINSRGCRTMKINKAALACHNKPTAAEPCSCKVRSMNHR